MGGSIGRIDPRALRDALRHHTDVLVWFTASWCSPSPGFAGPLEVFAIKYQDRVHVMSVEVDRYPELRRRYQIAGFPTFVIFHRGNRVWQQVGFDQHTTADDLAAVLLPVLEVVGNLDPRIDISPAVRDRWRPRMLYVPSDLDTTTEVFVTCSHSRVRAREIQPGSTVIVGVDELVEVRLRADHRQNPPIDPGVLHEFLPGCIDRLTITGRDVRLPGLADVPAVSLVTSVELDLRGAAEETVEEVLRLPNLVSLVGTDDLPVPHSARIVVNGQWKLPELQDRTDGKPDHPATSDERMDEFDATLARSTVVVLAFTARWIVDRGTVQTWLRRVTRDQPIVVIDADHEPDLTARFGIRTLPTMVVLWNGRQVWRSSEIFADGFDGRLRGALQDAANLTGPPTATLPEFVTHPPRTFTLPAGPQPFWVELVPPGRFGEDATQIRRGGHIDVPAGWSVAVELGPDRLRDNATPTSLASEIDELRVMGVGTLGHREIRRLASFRRLRTLQLLPERITRDATYALRSLSGLSSLDLFAYTTDDFLAFTSEIDALRLALPQTIVNENWSSFRR
ncbi:thioredoxin family protein [Amycolatopsis sp. NPDC049868]|uniref:thioredoxin family protein n=1 Tax=Amycolatopsis sp. NPDC049868 TaxID=3363934 RepID=UPI003794910C